MVNSRRLTGEDIMFTNILLPVDGSRASKRSPARHRAGEEPIGESDRADRNNAMGRLIPQLAVVIPEVVIPQGEYDYKREAIAACILQNVVADAHSAAVQVESTHRCHGDPYRAIIDTAAQEGWI